MLLRFIVFMKDLLLFSRIGYLLLPFSHLHKFLSNFSLLTAWVSKQNKKVSFTDFYKPRRNYLDRFKLYQYVMDTAQLAEQKIHYMEFGVASGHSYKWWLANNKSADSRFFGFDTFEGLPEDWAMHKKGDMSHGVPIVDDRRASFYKGLFQDTFYKFLEEYRSKEQTQKVIHMDADLYSSTLFVLTMLAPYLKPGDIILFDEFSVPNHEFAAWNDFLRSYYLEFETLGAVNNFYQCAFRLVK